MTDFDKAILTPHGWRLVLVGIGLVLGLGLYHLGTIGRNGHYVPVAGKPNLCLDTRTGELHLVRPAATLPAEVDAAGADPRALRLQRALTD